MSPDSDPPLKITDDDLDRAVVGRLPVSRPATSDRPIASPRTSVEGWNGVAVWSAVVALLAVLLALILAVLGAEESGLALFGLIVGLGAIGLGCAALARPTRSRLRGTGLAVGGIVAGIVAVAGCLFLFTNGLARPEANFAQIAF